MSKKEILNIILTVLQDVALFMVGWFARGVNL